MAHAGQQFKVLWRRDLCLNCSNYKFGLPEAWEVSGVVGTNGPPPNVHNFPKRLCRPVTNEINGQPRWETNSFPLAGHDVIVKLSLKDFLDGESWTDLVFQIWFIHALMYERTIRSAIRGSCRAYLSPDFATTPPDVFRADLWGGEWNSDRMAAGFAKWDIWPEP